jgi:hypothetical protein
VSNIVSFGLMHHLMVVCAVRFSGPRMATLGFAVHVSLLGSSGFKVLVHTNSTKQEIVRYGVDCAVFVPKLQVDHVNVPAPQVTRPRADRV